MLSSDTKSYVIFRQPNWGWTACLGNCNSKYGFIGGMREFVYMNQYTTPQTAQRVKNYYLTWDNSIRAYYRFQSQRYLNKDEFRPLYSSLTTNVTTDRDYISNDICYPPTWENQPFLSFPRDGIIKGTTIDGRWNPKSTGYEYSMSMWIRISPDSCT